MKWLWAITPPSVVAVLTNWLFPALIVSGQRETWVSLAYLQYAVQGLLAAWAGWRVARRHVGGLWAAGLAGGATLLAGYCFVFGLAWATGPFRPPGFQDLSIPPAVFVGLGLMALAATVLGFVGSKVASALDGRYATHL